MDGGRGKVREGGGVIPGKKTFQIIWGSVCPLGSGQRCGGILCGDRIEGPSLDLVGIQLNLIGFHLI